MSPDKFVLIEGHSGQVAFSLACCSASAGVSPSSERLLGSIPLTFRIERLADIQT